MRFEYNNMATSVLHCPQTDDFGLTYVGQNCKFNFIYGNDFND